MRATARAIAGALGAASLLVCAASAGARGPLYGYVDANGVHHFTNVPNDTRYSPVELTKELQAPRRGAVPDYRGWDGLILLNARAEDVPPALVKAVIAAESAFDPEAVSHKGALGLMQLMPATAAELGIDDPLVPDDNVRGGTRYLRLMLDRYGDMNRALAAYNAGPQAVDRFRGVPPYRETRDYVRRVLTYYRHYHGDFGR
jgi:soluble lytic murein transglycosylase